MKSVKTPRKGSIPRYELTDIDKRFLEAVDMIQQRNQQQGIEPTSDKGISRLISNDTSTIAKIRRSQRGVTLEQIKLLSTHFNLDYNFFFRQEYSVLMQSGIEEMFRAIQEQLNHLQSQYRDLQERISKTPTHSDQT